MAEAVLLLVALCSGQTPAPGEPAETAALAAAQNPQSPPALPPDTPKSEPAAPPPVPPAATPERWFIMRMLQGTWYGSVLDDNRTQFTGWTAMSYTASSDRVSNLPMVFNDRANEFLLQQQWMRLDRSVVTSNTTEPTFGYHLDVLFGSDYRWTLMRGLLNEQLENSKGNQNLYGVDPIQFYVNAYVPTLFQGTEFRIGRMYNPWGVESLEAITTPFRSRSYTFNNTPFTFMGISAAMTFTPRWSATVALANGNDVFLGPQEEARFFGVLKWNLPGNLDTLALGTTAGRGRFNAGEPFNPATVGLAQEPAGQNNFNSIDLVYTHMFTPLLSYTFETQYSYQTAVPANVPGGIVRPGAVSGTAHWVSGVQYLKYSITPRLNLVTRVGTFDDVDGQRTGFRGVDNHITFGANFYYTKAIIIRPEVRYDYNTNPLVFEGHHDLFTASGGVIVRW